MKNKRGAMGIIILFIIIFTTLIIGIVGAGAIAVLDLFSDEITPIMTDLGVLDVSDTTSVNLSEVGEYTFGTLDIFIQALPWILGLGYGCALIFTIVFSLGYKTNPHPVFLGFYAALMLLLVFGSIILSNIYQDMYVGTNEIATRLQEQTMMSYLILYSPHIMTMIAVIAGIIMFTRSPGESGGEIDIGI